MPLPRRAVKVDPAKDDVDEEMFDEDEEDEEDEEFEAESGMRYEPSERLQEYHWQRRTIKDLFEMMSTPYLELNPDYQRDVVWSTDRMTRLINSLICNFYVPPVIFNVQKTMGENGTERYKRISVDGKQRLSSIREFVNGNIPCTDKNGKKWYFANNGDSVKINKRILDEKFKRTFLQQELVCAEYAALERKQEEDLFSRVQLGVPLTPAEKLRASSGAWQAFAIDLEKQYPELMDTVDNRRGRSFQLVLQIFKQILNADQYSPKYSAGATALKGFCDRPSLLDESFKATARRVFNTYNEILKKHPETFENHAYTHATKYSPIEFVGAAVLIHQYPQRSNPTLLSGDILHMRRHLRELRQDLRSNTTTWKCVIEFIAELEAHRGGVNVTTKDNFQVAVQNMSMENAGEGGSSLLPPPIRQKPKQGSTPPAARVKSAGRKASIPTTAYIAPSPTPSMASLPPKPEMTGHVRFQSPITQVPQLPTALSTQQQPPTAPLPLRLPQRLPTGPVAQRQPPSPYAPMAPLGHPGTRNVADRFRAVNTSPHVSPQLFGGGIGNDGESRRRGANESNGANDGGLRSNKRQRTDSELLQQQIKREEGVHDYE